MGKLFAALAAVGIVTSLAHDVAACSFAGPEAHVVTPDASDTSPPAALAAPGVTVSRGHGPEGNGCSQSMTSCDDAGKISIHVVAPADDRTPPERMGFAVTLVAGTLPEGASITSPVRATDGAIMLIWADGATDEQEPIGFTLSVSAMDESGKTGEPAIVRVLDDGDSGCRLASRRLRGSWLPDFALALLVLGGLHAGARRVLSRRSGR